MSKAIADKCDAGCLIAKVEPTELEQISPYVKEYGAPTHVTDIYKLRSGTYKGTRIWSRVNLGTGEKTDLFITDENNNLVTMKDYEYMPKLPGESIWISKDFLQSIPIGLPNELFEKEVNEF